MNRILTALSIGVLISVMACGSVWAQATAQISGAVQDQSGAVLPGAEVTATQTDTGVSRATSASGGDRCLCEIANQRPDLVLTNVYLDTSGRPGTQYLNPAAFADPAIGTLGSLGRVTLKLPPVWQFDMSVSRVFRFREARVSSSEPKRIT
jgi:hypothetical protein